jgi:CXXX repeat modification system protein
MKKLVGKVTVEEKDEILALFERRNGLSELSKIVTAENDALYEKLVKDMGVTATKFQRWWDDTSLKYRWEKDDSKRWEIDFDTCEIFLLG